MQLRVSATALAILLSAPLTFAGTLAPGGGSPTGVLDANSNVGTTLATTLAGERNASSATDSYVAVRQEANASIISKTTAVTIGGGVANDTHLYGAIPVFICYHDCHNWHECFRNREGRVLRWLEFC